MSIVEAVLQTLSSLKFESTSTDQADNRPTTFDAETIETAVRSISKLFLGKITRIS